MAGFPTLKAHDLDLGLDHTA